MDAVELNWNMINQTPLPQLFSQFKLISRRITVDFHLKEERDLVDSQGLSNQIESLLFLHTYRNGPIDSQFSLVDPLV